MSVLDLIEKVGEKESALTKTDFISPVFNNTRVATTVMGMVYTFSIPKVDPGWYRIRARNIKTARINGEASLGEIESYLKRLRPLRATLAFKQDGCYQAVVDKGDRELSGRVIPVLLFSDSANDFDRVICRSDGVNIWFESVEVSNDPAKGEYLRKSLDKFTDPKKIAFSGLLFDEKAAYALRYKIDEKTRVDVKQQRLQRDVEHAGGKFVKFDERSDFYSVTYTVDGEKYTSYISKDPSHRVVTAGVCLQGGDNAFDLTSLITVLREGQHEGLIHRYDNTI